MLSMFRVPTQLLLKECISGSKQQRTGGDFAPGCTQILPLQSNNLNSTSPPPRCCTSPHAASSPCCSPTRLLGHMPPPQHLCRASPALCCTALSKKKKTSPSPLEEGCSSLSQSVWSLSSPTPVPGPSKCLLHLIQLLRVTWSLDTTCCHQLLLLSSATERDNPRLKESKSSNETLSLSCKSLFGSSVTSGAVRKKVCHVPG